MLREEQIDLRRQRARAANFSIENLGKNRVFSEYRVSNPQTKGQYTVTVRGFDTGDNVCTCPDFKSNTLGTCKHIEAVLEKLQTDGEAVKRRKATVTRPEVSLDYGAANSDSGCNSQRAIPMLSTSSPGDFSTTRASGIAAMNTIN